MKFSDIPFTLYKISIKINAPKLALVPLPPDMFKGLLDVVLRDTV